MQKFFWLTDKELQTLVMALSGRVSKRSARLLAAARREIKDRE